MPNTMNDMQETIRKWVHANVDFAFILAAFTETPRWTVAFQAIHEPAWIGVPLGVLLSFATAKAWRRYFENHDKRLLSFNVASMAIAVLVIAPVLYTMTRIPAQGALVVDLATVLDPIALGAWACLLAVTTFLPLVQLAAVTELKPVVQMPVVHKAKTPTANKTIDAQATVQPSNDDAQCIETPSLEDALPVNWRVQRAKALKSEGLSNAQIGQEMGVHRNTVGKLLKESA